MYAFTRSGESVEEDDRVDALDVAISRAWRVYGVISDPRFTAPTDAPIPACPARRVGAGRE
jgi:hypothetical protein